MLAWGCPSLAPLTTLVLPGVLRLVTHGQLPPQLAQLNVLTLRFFWPGLTDPGHPKLTFKDSDPPQLLVLINED